MASISLLKAMNRKGVGMTSGKQLLPSRECVVENRSKASLSSVVRIFSEDPRGNVRVLMNFVPDGRQSINIAMYQPSESLSAVNSTLQSLIPTHLSNLTATS